MATRKETVTKPRYWLGDEPTTCQISGHKITKAFVDGATRSGTWAIMCLLCARTVGMGVAPGRGQLYEKQADGRWLKTEG
jgi:hypothetical protein